MKTVRTLILLCLTTILVSSCSAPNAQQATQKSFVNQFGEGYRTLKFPVEDKYIGVEWLVKQDEPNLTKGLGVRETREMKTLSTLSSGDADKLYLSLTALYGLGVGASAKYDFEKNLSTRGMTRIVPENIGDIAFKPGVPYVTEAIAVDNFAVDSVNQGGAGLKLKGKQYGVEDVEAGGATGGSVGATGEKLIIAYKVERAKESTYKQVELARGELSLASPRLNLGPDLSGSLSYVSVANGTMRPAYKYAWACEDARVKAGTIKSAWVITLEDERVRSIAFPASTDGRSDSGIPGCRNFKASIRSERDSNSGAIERTTATIQLKRSELDPDRLAPVAGDFGIVLSKEVFELENL